MPVPGESGHSASSCARRAWAARRPTRRSGSGATRRRREATEEGEDGASADEAAAERLLARRASQLGRVPDPRVRRQRAYALLARNGFDPGVCSSVAKRFAEMRPAMRIFVD